MAGSEGKQRIYFISTHLSSHVTGTENGEDDDENDNCASSSRSKDFIDVMGYWLYYYRTILRTSGWLHSFPVTSEERRGGSR